MKSFQLRRPSLISAAGLAWMLLAARAAAAAGDEHWDVPFDWPGTTNTVYALTLHNGQVCAGGLFSTPAISGTIFVEVWMAPAGFPSRGTLIQTGTRHVRTMIYETLTPALELGEPPR